MNLFKNLGLSRELFSTIELLKFTKPTEIQEKSIPHIVKGKDVIGESATGSGKTLAFGCGIVECSTPGKGVQAVVLTPTRELAEQVKNSIKQLSRDKKLRITAIYGGVSINPQISDLRSTDVVVATPGRMLDHLQRGTLNLSKVKLVVLDEADRMLDMGFIDDVEKIIKKCHSRQQTLFFSATISHEIRRLSNKYMNNAVKISAVQHVDPNKLKQVYYDISRNKKLSLLVQLLKHESVSQAMVFCNTRKTTDFVAKNLKVNGVKAVAIHGGLTQNKRMRMMKTFDDKAAAVLVCTDVAARGLHIEDVSHIYNYGIPMDAKDYVHRIGRTARAGEEGEAINLISDIDYDNFSKVLRTYSKFKIDKMETPALERIQTIQVTSDFRSKRNNRGKPFYKRRIKRH
jgi:ATP-dependent RNA helicase DeaD